MEPSADDGVTNVVAYADSDDEGAPEFEVVTSIVESRVEATPGSSSSDSSSAAGSSVATPVAVVTGSKRQRATRTDEYEVLLAPGAETIRLPVPREAVRGRRVVVSISFAVE